MNLFLILPAIFLLAGVPIAFALLGGSALWAIASGNPAFETFIANRMVSGVNNFVLLSIPLFLLAGELMNRSMITHGLINLASFIFGRMRGSLAQVNVAASVFFAGISGAAVADTAAIGSIMVPEMKKRGYDEHFASAVTVASSSIGPVIPPSIVMVIYGITMELSITRLFLAGVIPGLVMAASMMIYIHFATRKMSIQGSIDDKLPFGRTLVEAAIALAMPGIIVGGMVSGVFTVTESAAVAVLYALGVGVVRRKVRIGDIAPIILSTAIQSSVILLIIASGAGFGWIVNIEGIPRLVVGLFHNISDNPVLVLLMINFVLLIAGMFLETSVAIVIFAPILAPVALAAGVDPVHFAIIVTVNLCVGLTTPPLGVCLFVMSSISGQRVEKISRAILPFVAVNIVALLVITFVPQLTLWLPSQI